jgi:pre-mRNA branch site protein p14
MSRSNKLAPEANRILFIKNLPYSTPASDLFPLFSKFGPVRQIRQGNAPSTRGTAFVVYDEVSDAKQACDKLNGFNFMGRYLVVLFHQMDKMVKTGGTDGGGEGFVKIEGGKNEVEERRERLERVKRENGLE